MNFFALPSLWPSSNPVNNQGEEKANLEFLKNLGVPEKLASMALAETKNDVKAARLLLIKKYEDRLKKNPRKIAHHASRTLKFKKRRMNRRPRDPPARTLFEEDHVSMNEESDVEIVEPPVNFPVGTRPSSDDLNLNQNSNDDADEMEAEEETTNGYATTSDEEEAEEEEDERKQQQSPVHVRTSTLKPAPTRRSHQPVPKNQSSSNFRSSRAPAPSLATAKPKPNNPRSNRALAAPLSTSKPKPNNQHKLRVFQIAKDLRSQPSTLCKLSKDLNELDAKKPAMELSTELKSLQSQYKSGAAFRMLALLHSFPSLLSSAQMKLTEEANNTKA